MMTITPVQTRTIREATAADLPRILEMGRDFLRASLYRDFFAENPDQMTTLAMRLMREPMSAILLALHDDRPVGMLGLVCYRHFISDEPIAGEVFYWVDAAARGIGVRLLRAAERWAHDHGATAMQMIAPDPRAEQLYSALGYRPVERTFQRSLR